MQFLKRITQFVSRGPSKTLFVGLGNPGKKYEKNRHNVGFLCIDFLSEGASFTENKKTLSHEATNSVAIFLKPDTFMNDSGKSAKAALSYYKLPPTALVVLHDDLDIKLGEFKIQSAVGPKVHNGVNSIESVLHSSNFLRVRIGVDNRDPNARTPGQAYVLSDFKKEEMQILHTVFEKIKEQLQKNHKLLL